VTGGSIRAGESTEQRAQSRSLSAHSSDEVPTL
jgi:hypothetical protein